MVYGLVSPETFRALVEERGWTWKRAEAWLTEQVCEAVLARSR